MSYPRGASWRDYAVTLTWPNGRETQTSIRAISRRDAAWRAARKWPAEATIGDPS